MSVRRRLLIGLLALVLAVDGLAGLLSYRRALDSAGALLDYQLKQMALSLRDQGVAVPDVPIPGSDGSFDFAVQIWDKGGDPIYASRPDLPLAHEGLLGYANLNIEGERWRAFALQTTRRVILVAQPLRVRQEQAGAVALRTLAPLLILTPLLAFAIWWMVARTLEPIKRTVREVQSRDADSLAPLVAHDLPLEIAPLIAELNRLLERLAVAFRAQRAFIADAAHELRSPLTALRLQLQLLGRAGDDAGRAQALQRLGAASDRAGTLVQQLLTLARNEPGAAEAALLPLALDATVREALADTGGLAVARGTDLALEAEPDLAIAGDADSLRVLVRNLVDNAVRYAPAGGRVLVRLGRHGDAALLEVEDSGPGIPPEQRERVFDRFHRIEDTKESGSGLGLAIVKAVAERHHAAIALGASPLGGLKVSVSFPLL